MASQEVPEVGRPWVSLRTAGLNRRNENLTSRFESWEQKEYIPADEVFLFSVWHTEGWILCPWRLRGEQSPGHQISPTIWNFIPSVYMHSNNVGWEIISIRSRTLSLWSPGAVLLLLYLNRSYIWIKSILAALSLGFHFRLCLSKEKTDLEVLHSLQYCFQ